MKKYRLLICISVAGFLLNLVWENVQAPLYEGYEDFWQHFFTCFWASLGDVLVILGFWALFASYYKDPFWVKHINWKDTLILLLLGALVAIGFEQLALGENYWLYAEAMPIVPYLSVGLSPLLQMMLLPLLTFWLSGHLI